MKSVSGNEVMLHLSIESESPMCGVQSLPLGLRDLDFRATGASLHPQNTGISYPLGPVAVCPIITELNLALDLH